MGGVRFGIGFELNLTRSANRLQILLLVAMIASFVLWLFRAAMLKATVFLISIVLQV